MPAHQQHVHQPHRMRPVPVIFERLSRTTDHRKHAPRTHTAVPERLIGPWYVIWSEEGNVLCAIPFPEFPRSFPKTIDPVPEPVRELARLLSRAACRCGRCCRHECRGRSGSVTVVNSPVDAWQHRVPMGCIRNRLWILPEFNGMYWTARIRDKFGITI